MGLRAMEHPHPATGGRLRLNTCQPSWPYALLVMSRSKGTSAVHTTHKSDVALLKEFFGSKPGQTLTEFGAELKALTPEDKAELVALTRARLEEEAPVAA